MPPIHYATHLCRHNVKAVIDGVEATGRRVEPYIYHFLSWADTNDTLLYVVIVAVDGYLSEWCYYTDEAFHDNYEWVSERAKWGEAGWKEIKMKGADD